MRSFLLSMRNRHFLATDMLIFGISPFLAMWIRLESLGSVEPYAQALIIYTWVFLFLKPFVFLATGLYSRYWPYASVDALKALASAAGATLLLEVCVFFGLFIPFEMLPAGFPNQFR